MNKQRWARWAWGIGLALGGSATWAASALPVELSAQEDLVLWHQAGMSFLPPVTEFDEVRHSSEYQRYQTLRSQRLLERTAETAIVQQPTAAVPASAKQEDPRRQP